MMRQPTAPHWRSGYGPRIISKHLSVARMSHFSGKIGFALVLAALALSGPTAQAQSAPVSYWIPGWPLGFGSSLSTAQGADRYGNFPSFDGSDAHYPRYTLPNGLFVGAEGGD